MRRLSFILMASMSFFCMNSLLESVAPATDSIIVEQRMLARVRDHIVTVSDVMKKLDVVFYQQFPQFRNSVKHRVQFYDLHWKEALQEILERQVLTIFAAENKMEVTQGDVREEMEEMFGPNVLLHVYEAHLSFDDASDLVRQDIVMRRILQFYVRSPAFAQITPQKIKDAYESTYGMRGREEKVSWQILSLRAPSSSSISSVMKKIVDGLNTHTTTIDQEKQTLSEGCELILSPPFVTDETKIAASLKPILDKSQNQMWTEPIQGKEAKDGFVKWNSYRVNERFREEKIPLSQVEDKIREDLLKPLFEEKKQAFISDLMKKYDATYCLDEREMETYKPFRYASL